jgi:hypothetical protein
LIGVGQTANGTTNLVEIIDLLNPSFSCPAFPSLPVSTFAAIGGLTFEEIPTVCGGDFKVNKNYLETLLIKLFDLYSCCNVWCALFSYLYLFFTFNVIASNHLHHPVSIARV